MYSVDHKDIFDHAYCTKPGNLFKIYKIMKYQYLTKVVSNLKEAF